MTPQIKIAYQTERIFTQWLSGRAVWAAMFAAVLLSSAYAALILVEPAWKMPWPAIRPAVVFLVWAAGQCGFALACIAKLRFERRAHAASLEAERERRRLEAPAFSRSRYRDLFENVGEMIAVVDPEGRYLYVNPAWERCFGRTAEEAAALPDFAAAFPPGLQAHAAALFERALAGERIEESPLRVSGADGALREIEASLYCRTGARTRSAVRCIFRDVTLRRQRESRLAMQVAVSQILQEATNTEGALPRILGAIGTHIGFDLVQLWRVTPDFQALRYGTMWMAEDCVFAAALERTGQIEFASGEALPGMVWASGAPLWVEDIRDDALFASRLALAGDALVTCWGVPVRSGNRVIAVVEFFSRTRQTENRELRTAVETVCASIGQFLARSAEERRVTELNRQRESILNTVADGILGMDRHGRVTFANPAAAAMLGATPNGLVGRFVHAIAHEDGCSAACAGNCPLRQAFFAASNATSRDVFCRPDGGSFPVEFSVTPMYVQGAAAGRVLHFRDVSQREELDRMKDEFIATVSHELRTPLTSIRGALGLLSAGLLGNLSPKAENLLKIAVSNSDRLVRLINDVLDLERMQSGRAPLNIRQVHPGELAEQAIEAMAPVADAANVRLAMDADSVMVDADPDRLQQVLVNLLSNAIKFSPPQSTVRLRIKRTPEGVALSVEDQGRGIPEEKLETIFDRFQQVDVSDSRQKGGTGLGLAICRTIVNQHGGRIWAERNAGPGATLRVLLPSSQQEVEVARPAEQGTVLICDDDAEMRAALGNSLRARGYTVHEVATGREALSVSRENGVDAILLDLDLPDMSGWQVLRELKDYGDTADIPVVMLGGSGARLERDHLECPDGWLTKHAGGEALMRELARVMDAGPNPACVLLVEDDVDLARVVMANFEHVGIAVHHAGTRAAAIEFCREKNPDLLILDLALPDGNGFELVEWLRQEHRLRGLPLVVYSGREVSAAERLRLQLGPAEFLTKSRVPPAQMESLVRTMLWRYGGTHEINPTMREPGRKAMDGQEIWNAAF